MAVSIEPPSLRCMMQLRQWHMYVMNRSNRFLKMLASRISFIREIICCMITLAEELMMVKKRLKAIKEEASDH